MKFIFQILITAFISKLCCSELIFDLAEQCDCGYALARKKWSPENLGCLFKVPLNKDDKTALLSKTDEVPCILMNNKKDLCSEYVDAKIYKCHVISYHIIEQVKSLKKSWNSLISHSVVDHGDEYSNYHNFEFPKEDLNEILHEINVNVEKENIKNIFNETIIKNITALINHYVPINDCLEKETLKENKGIKIYAVKDNNIANAPGFLLHNFDSKNPNMTLLAVNYDIEDILGLIKAFNPKEEDKITQAKNINQNKNQTLEDNESLVPFAGGDDLQIMTSEVKTQNFEPGKIQIVNNDIEKSVVMNGAYNPIGPYLDLLADRRGKIQVYKRVKKRQATEENTESNDSTTEGSEETTAASDEESTTASTENSGSDDSETDNSETDDDSAENGFNTTIRVTLAVGDNSTTSANGTTLKPTTLPANTTCSTTPASCTSSCCDPSGVPCDPCDPCIYVYPTEEPPCSMASKVWSFCVNYVAPVVAIGISAIAVFTLISML